MGKHEGKKLTKKGGTKTREAASPSPSRGGDVRGNGGIESGRATRISAKGGRIWLPLLPTIRHQMYT